MIEQYLSEHFNKKYTLIWVESICTLEKVIENNIINTKLKSQDYVSWNPELAVEDFRKRIHEYEKVYESLSVDNDGEDCIFIQIINHNLQIVMRNLKGYLPSKLLSYLINLHTGERPIYFTRHGQSEHNILNIIGGDANLSSWGRKYAERLKDFFQEESKKFEDYPEKPILYCSTLKRSIQTAEYIKFIGNTISIKALDEINVGICDGLTYDQVQVKYPKDFEERNKDKLRFRYPRGESYMDMILRIEPLIFELERHGGPVIVVGHQGILRCLYGYFALAPIEDIPMIDIPLNTLIKFVPHAYGFNEERLNFDPDTGKITKVNNVKTYKDNIIHTPAYHDLKKSD
jgi:broad specificity phosphatase PhoE